MMAVSESGGNLPLAGIRVLEFTHLIAGPTAGMILANLGADVIKVEPAPHGDSTRRLEGFTGGFSDFFNRNKRSIAVDLKKPESAAVVAKLCGNADVLIENFSPGTMDRLGLGFEKIHASFPRIVYCSIKGFLPGPYENRTALDEVVQFMGGLAYMTGPVGEPLRAGTSAVDLMGGAMAAVATLASLRERDQTGVGQLVQSALFESVAFMMGQHMAASALLGTELPPMPAREGGWSIYRLFRSASGQQVFIAITSDALWQRFCAAFGLEDLGRDARLETNALRLAARPWLLPRIEATLEALDADVIMDRCEQARIPFSGVGTVTTLFSDPQLRASGILSNTLMRDGSYAMLPGLPVKLSNHQFELRCQPPKVGEHTIQILEDAGTDRAQIGAWIDQGVLHAPLV